MSFAQFSFKCIMISDTMVSPHKIQHVHPLPW